MTDKRTGSAAAAREIDKFQYKWDFDKLMHIRYDHPEPEERVPAIEAIILKHCPEDKAGKLVEALKSIASIQPPKADPRFYELNSGPVGVIAKMVKEAQDALAEYEKVNK